MLEGLEIKNFRGFKQLKMDEFARVNILTGLNDAGKTSVLEALYLLASGPQAGHNAVIALAGIRQSGLAIGDASENPWSSIFHNFDMSVPVVLKDKRSAGSYELQLQEDNSGKKEITAGVQPANNQITGSNSITILEKRTGRAEKIYRLSMTVRPSQNSTNPQNLTIDFAIDPPTKEIFAKSQLLKGNFGIDLATAYSKFLRRPPGIDLLEALQEVDNRIESLEILSNGPSSQLHARLNGTLIPFSLLGDGPVALTRYLISMVGVSGGSLLIDEIGAGVHHSILPMMWRSLYAAAKKLNVQIFATTHSQETVIAAAEVINKNIKDLAIFRLERRIGEGETIATKYSGERLSTAIELNAELR